MHRRSFLRVLAGAAGLPWLGSVPALAQATIRIVFPFAPGGSGDALARLIGEKMRLSLNQPVIVENKTGAAGRVGVAAVKSAEPNGTTLLLTPVAPMSIFPHVYKALDYDPVADFEPVSQVATFDFAVAVAHGINVKSLKELVDWARANPRQANYASPATGSLPHFLGLMFGRLAGLDFRHVGYRGSAAALNDLIGGQVPIVFTTTSDVVENHKVGRIRVLATSDRQRSPFLPDVPTFLESGFDIQGRGWYGIYAPAKTPAAVVARLNKAIVESVQAPEVKERLLGLGLQPTGTSAHALAEIQKADSNFWGPTVKASGFTPEQ